ncbi:hypothetical protein [uncultured Roseovarius sp.]|jgi:hypothetical protein|uniref:hypothetical protein n=1 Tax=uncultured Roseovarius sp. TaxID=293344 RepID=UPI00344327E9
MRPASVVLPATSVFGPAEDLDDAPGAVATGARFAQGEWDDLGVGSRLGGLFGALDVVTGWLKNRLLKPASITVAPSSAPSTSPSLRRRLLRNSSVRASVSSCHISAELAG